MQHRSHGLFSAHRHHSIQAWALVEEKILTMFLTEWNQTDSFTVLATRLCSLFCVNLEAQNFYQMGNGVSVKFGRNWCSGGRGSIFDFSEILFICSGFVSACVKFANIVRKFAIQPHQHKTNDLEEFHCESNKNYVMFPQVCDTVWRFVRMHHLIWSANLVVHHSNDLDIRSNLIVIRNSLITTV